MSYYNKKNIAIQELNVQLKELQGQFIETHKYVEQLRQSGI